MTFKFSALLLALSAASGANALTAGDIAFNSFNADEDGFSIVALTNISANTTIYFGDNEFVSGAFNSGESFSKWVSGAGVINAGTVIRFTSVDTTSLAASVGSFTRETVSGSANWGLSNSNETLYAFQGSSATAPTSFLAAITNGDFAVDGSLTGTGLVEGVTAIRLNANNTSATPDYAVYNGVRSGLSSFASYLPLLNNASNWTVDTTAPTPPQCPTPRLSASPPRPTCPNPPAAPSPWQVWAWLACWPAAARWPERHVMLDGPRRP
jgi:hypothetical protein